MSAASGEVSGKHVESGVSECTIVLSARQMQPVRADHSWGARRVASVDSSDDGGGAGAAGGVRS